MIKRSLGDDASDRVQLFGGGLQKDQKRRKTKEREGQRARLKYVGRDGK